ncbi:MAG: hypothetical protein E6G20_08650 [Actinobacteria bacterium]|nr:MAG: hypothetical protein E6G20_08650 [Actinomycetota bacterium]
MISCPSCGQENPEGFRLCGMCGAPLAVAAPAQREERKVVTVLFCDLVGFTQRAEQLDPEDVRAILAPYHGRLRSELERHGGTVEKFIGDAVMALFGAPVAHEDDPERAVRAALAIRDFALEEGLELRVGVTTGEALISLGASPAEGEGMASGDVVNTAARLQSAAPVNGILADETTYRATRQAVDYCEAAAVQAKGKAEPIPVWEALAARSRFGVDVTHHARAELVGRERELSVLRDAFERARHERIPQLVTLVAVPGMGKSRLVYELSQIVDADPELVTWRQGRCLAYGDGVAFWALAEMVKAQAGIDERDTEAEAAAKLHSAVEDALADESDARWVESHLRPLVGLEAETGLGGDRRGEAFAAWRRFLEALAEERPLVLVLEDLHWADEGLLDFVDELVDWLSGVPLLVVCSARPELLERRPGWGGGKLNASTIGLSRLSQEQTALLISRILERSLLPAEIQQARSTPSSSRSSTSSAAQRTTFLFPRRCRGSSPPASTGSRPRRRLCSRMPRSSARSSGRVRCAETSARRPCSSTPSSARASSPASAARRSGARASGPSRTCSCETSPTDRSRVPSAPQSIARPPSGSRASVGPRTTRNCSRFTGVLRSS